MTSSAQKMRDYRGPALFSFGFRPLFLAAGLWGFFGMLVWLAMLAGILDLPTALDPVSWHAHEFLFGYLGAAVGGFLLTAVPNWTGRLPILGWPLALLSLCWLVGRVAMAFSAQLPFWLTLVADMSYLTLLAAALAREILAGRNWRNLPVAGLVTAFALANLYFHIEAGWGEYAAAGPAARIAIGAAIVLISLIGGRIVPSFTRNWLVKVRPDSPKPAPASRADMGIVLASLVALVIWVVLPESMMTGLVCLLVGLANIWRMARWQGVATAREPLVLILHVGFAFVPLGFLMIGATAFAPDVFYEAGVLHAWLAGAIPVMTVAVMTRATLGHTGRTLTADGPTTLIYAGIVTSALLRLVAAFLPDQPMLLNVSGAVWLVAFGIFVVHYGAMLTRPRAGG